MTSKNFNRVLTVVVNKLNKCYFNFTKPEDMKSVTIEKSVFLVEHRLGLEIDNCDMFLYITVDNRRMYEIDLDNEVKDSNELFNRVQYLLSLAYGGVYNGDYDELLETEETEETEEIEETEETEQTEEVEEEATTHITSETLPHVDIDCSNLKKVPKNCLYGMFGGFPSISEMYNDKCFCCIADRKGNECKGKETCGKTWKRYEAIIKPEWHHVSLATLANLDFDMLDKKRQVYLKAHRELKRTLADLSKCKSGHTYEARARKFMRDMISQYYDNEISYAMRKYLDLQLSMSNVTNGVWSSYVEPAMGLHESRRYSRPTLKY